MADNPAGEWQVRLLRSARRNLAALEDQVRSEALDAIQDLGEDPFPDDCIRMRGYPNRGFFLDVRAEGEQIHKGGLNNALKIHLEPHKLCRPPHLSCFGLAAPARGGLGGRKPAISFPHAKYPVATGTKIPIIARVLDDSSPTAGGLVNKNTTITSSPPSMERKLAATWSVSRIGGQRPVVRLLLMRSAGTTSKVRRPQTR